MILLQINFHLGGEGSVVRIYSPRQNKNDPAPQGGRVFFIG